MTEEPLNRSNVLNTFAEGFTRIGAQDEAIAALEEALEIRQEAYGTTPAWLILSKAAVLNLAGEPEQALSELSAVDASTLNRVLESELLKQLEAAEAGLGNAAKARHWRQQRRVLNLPWLRNLRSALTTVELEPDVREALLADVESFEKELAGDPPASRSPSRLPLLMGVLLLALFLLFFQQWVARRRLRQELERKTEDLGRAVALLDLERTERQASHDEVLEEVGGLVHDLRTPLSVITLALERLEIPNSFVSEQALHRSVSRMSQMVSELLTLVTLEKELRESDEGACEMAGALERVVHEAGASAASRGVDLEVTSKANLIARIPCPYIERVLWNLLSNAIKYSPQGGKIELALRDQGESLQVSVRDEGPGVSRSALTSLFEPFADIAKKRGVEGFGIGLATVKRTVERFGGTVAAESTPGRGLTVFINLPVSS